MLRKFVKVLPAGKTADARKGQRWEHMQDASGMVAIGTNADGTVARAHVAGCIMGLYAAHAGQFAAIGHGVRLVDDCNTGAGSVAFITRTGAATGAVYVFAAGTADRVRAAFDREGIALQSIALESKGKVPGATVTLPPDADGAACMRALRALGGTTRPPLGWATQPLPEAVQVATQEAPEAEADAPKVKVRKGKRAEA